MHPLANDFSQLFSGFQEGYGIYKLDGEKRNDGKILGKAYSITGPFTLDLWDKHLKGVQGLGVIPITKESTCKFGAIDIDEYNLDHISLVRKIEQNKIPAVVCRTKSGGAHVYIFLTEFIDAGIFRQKLHEIAAFLGYGSCEIFPRQAKLLAERGDSGNWLNMPYFTCDNTLRYAISPTHLRAIKVVDFVKLAHERSITMAQLAAIQLVAREELEGGPPCLQAIIRNGFPQGTRNNGLFNLGVYAKKLNPDNYEVLVEQYNRKYMDPPLDAVEVEAVKKSLLKKEYNYTCKAQPIQSYCNAAVCRTCKFGVGHADLGMPKLGTLTKLQTTPAIWFLDVETQTGTARLELLTEDLQNPMRFQNKCMEQLNLMPNIAKRADWQQVVMDLLSAVNIIEVPYEVTRAGRLMQYLEDFCTGRVTTSKRDELLLGKPYISSGEISFRMTDFFKYLDRDRFRDLDNNEVMRIIRDIKGYRKHTFNVKGKCVNVCVIPENTFTRQLESFETPQLSAPTPM